MRPGCASRNGPHPGFLATGARYCDPPATALLHLAARPTAPLVPNPPPQTWQASPLSMTLTLRCTGECTPRCSRPAARWVPKNAGCTTCLGHACRRQAPVRAASRQVPKLAAPSCLTPCCPLPASLSRLVWLQQGRQLQTPNVRKRAKAAQGNNHHQDRLQAGPKRRDPGPVRHLYHRRHIGGARKGGWGLGRSMRAHPLARHGLPGKLHDLCTGTRTAAARAAVSE